MSQLAPSRQFAIIKSMYLYKKISQLLPEVKAEAHCDIPCGIYDPTPAKIAAKTVQRMVMQIKELKEPKNLSDEHASTEYLNAITRRIQNKEKYSQICKEELSILWSDYFKPEHLEKYPDLHQTFWDALKLCSKNKHSIDEDLTHELVMQVDSIAKIFYETKSDEKRFEAYKEVTDKLF